MNTPGAPSKIQFQILTVFLALFCILPFAWLALYNFPVIDDFPCSIPARDSGIITSVHTWYKIWTARYFSATLWAVNPFVYGSLFGYKLTTWVLLGAMLVAYRLSLGYLFYTSKVLDSFKAWFFAFLLTAFFISNQPSLTEGLYYYNGWTCYQPGIIFFTLLASILIGKVYNENMKLNWWEWIFAAGLVVCMVGNNESIMVVSLSFLAGFFIIRLWLHKVVDWHSLVLLFLNLACTTFVLTAPGTQLRMQNTSASKPTISKLFTLYGSFFGNECLEWFLMPGIPGMILVVLWLFFQLFKSKQKINLKASLLWSGLVLGLFIASALPSFYGEGIIQPRTKNSVFYFYLLAKIALGFIWIQRIDFLKKLFLQHSYLFWIGLSAIFFAPNLKTAYGDLWSGAAKGYHQENQNRIEIIKLTKGAIVEFPPLKNRPKSFYATDIDEYPKQYVGFYANMFGKKWINLNEKKK